MAPLEYPDHNTIERERNPSPRLCASTLRHMADPALQASSRM
jgi:hypothetical protein